jgi:hypothetical protein
MRSDEITQLKEQRKHYLAEYRALTERQKDGEAWSTEDKERSEYLYREARSIANGCGDRRAERSRRRPPLSAFSGSVELRERRTGSASDLPQPSAERRLPPGCSSSQIRPRPRRPSFRNHLVNKH